MRSAHVLLVRPWDEQMSGSGCCGRLGGLGTELGRADDFAPQRCDMGEVVARVLAELGRSRDEVPG